MAPKRARSEESSDLPEQVMLPRHSPKKAQTSKKMKPDNSDVVSISSESDREAAEKAKRSKTRLTFGSIDPAKEVINPVGSPATKNKQSKSRPAVDSGDQAEDSGVVEKAVTKSQRAKARVPSKAISNPEDATPSVKTPVKSKQGKPQEVVPSEVPQKRNRKPSEKSRYMAENGDIVPDSEASPAKKQRPNKPSPSIDKNKGHVSEPWDTWSDSDGANLTKNDRNAAPSPPQTPRKTKNSTKEATSFKTIRSETKAHVDDRLNEETPTNKGSTSQKSKKRPQTPDEVDDPNSPPTVSFSRRSTTKRDRSPDELKDRVPTLGRTSSRRSHRKVQSDVESEDPTPIPPPKSSRSKIPQTVGSEDERATPTPVSSRKGKAKAQVFSDDETRTSRPSSAHKGKGKARARTPPDDTDRSNGAQDVRPRSRVEEKTPAKSKSALDLDSLKKPLYPDLPMKCASLTGFMHLPHTFSLDDRPSNLLSRVRVYGDLHKNDQSSFLSALNFIREGPMINPTRSRLHNLNNGAGGRLVFGNDENALFIFNGAVAYCSLFEPTTINGANIRCISVYPFKDDFSQWKKFVASAVQKKEFITYTDNDVLSFTTKKESDTTFSGGSRKSGPVKSPKKASKFFEQDNDSGDERSTFRMKVPDALSYKDRVPIYDARNTDFRLEEHFNEFRRLPLYQEDLPQLAVVTVGHTLSSFQYIKEKNLTGLQLNVIFVILHGFTKDDKAEEDSTT